MTHYYITYLDMLPQYHSASCRRDDGSTMLEAAPDSDWAIRSWDKANAPNSCLMSEPDRLRTAGIIADAAAQHSKFTMTSSTVIVTPSQNNTQYLSTVVSQFYGMQLEIANKRLLSKF